MGNFENMKLAGGFVLGVANGQILGAVNLMPASIQNSIVSSIQTQVISVAQTQGFTEVAGVPIADVITADALTTVLTDPVATNPLAWDENFLTAVLPFDAETNEQYIAYVQTGQTFANEATTMLADAGIANVEDLTSGSIQGLLTAVISSDPAIESAVMGALDPNGEMTLTDITGDIASGFDTIQNDYGDILNDPTQLNAETIGNILTAVTSESNILGSVITADMITSASEQIGGGIEQVVASGIVDSSGAGFDLSSMMADLTQPLEVCYSTLDATQKLLTPSLSGILNFDRNAFIANLGQLFSDGIQCGKNYAEFSGTDISAYEQYLDYSSYLFVGIEKYFKITDGLSDVRDEYNDFKNNVQNFMKTIAPYMENSYIQYAELFLDGTVQLLIPQAEDLVLAAVTLYNDALSDVPVAMDYRITVNTVIDHIAVAEVYINLVNNELKSLGSFGGKMIENLIKQRVNKIRNKASNVNSDSNSQATTQAPTTTTRKAPNGSMGQVQQAAGQVQQVIQNQADKVENWFQQIIGQIQNRV